MIIIWMLKFMSSNLNFINMKKLYFLILASITLFFNANAQDNVVAGSAMEAGDESSWTVTQLVPDYLATVTFGYTDDVPSEGSDGCMRVTCTNDANAGTNVLIWQEVNLEAGHQYVVDAAFKGSILAESFWAQWLVVNVNTSYPAEGSDYMTESDAVAQINSWNGGVSDWDLDITLQTWEFENGAQSDTVVVDEDGTYVYGVKIGIWNANQITYDVLIDNMTLTDLGDTGNGVADFASSSLKVYPNPATSTISIRSDKAFNAVRIINIAGQESMNVRNSGNIDVSGLKAGVYLIELMQDNATVARSQFIKR